MMQVARKIYKRFPGPVSHIDPELERRFLEKVDSIIPAEIGGVRVATDRVVVNTSQDAVVMQFWLDAGPDAPTGFVEASGRELRMYAHDLAGLAARRVDVALRGMPLMEGSGG